MLYTFSHYYLTTHIGRRASRDIYLSYPMGEPEHKIILKLYDPECRVPGTHAEDFLFAARRFKQLSHPHLIPIIDIGLEEGKPYVVSDYITNGSLRQHLEQRPANRLNLDEALRIIQDIGTAIVYAHAHTIIHKDIRPENILFNALDEALLGDFVLSELIQERGIQHQLDARTLNYMAPEQLNGISTPKSDQYALGCLLYEMLTGALPFSAGSGSLLDQQMTAEPTPPSTIVSGIPKAVEAAILQALSRQQDERYPDVETFLNSVQTATRPAPPVFPFARSFAQSSIADAPTRETGIQIHSAAGLLAQQPAEEMQYENTEDGEDEDVENTDDQEIEHMAAEDEEAENEGANDQVIEMAADQDAEEEEDTLAKLQPTAATSPEESQVQASPFFDIIADPNDETEEDEVTLSTTSSGSTQNPPSAPGIGSPDIPSPRVMFPLMQQYSQQQDNTHSAGEDLDDPFAYISTPVSATQPEDQDLNLSAMQYPKAEAPILPAGPVQRRQLAVINQPQLPGSATPQPQSSRNYTYIIQPPSRQKANSFLLIALVSIILASILSVSFNTAILAMAGTLPATANALALKQTRTQGQPQATPTQRIPATPTATTSTQPTPAGSKKNPSQPKSKPKQSSKPASTGGTNENSQPPVSTNPVYTPNTVYNPSPTPTPTPKPTPKPTPTPPPPIYRGQITAQATQTSTAVARFIPGVTVSNVKIDAYITTQGNGGGIVFRSIYRLRIGTDGSYDLVGPSATLASGSSPAIKTGNNVSNHVVVIAVGAKITVYVNSAFLLSVNDSAASSGSVGVMANNFGTSTTTTCAFTILHD